MQDDLRILEMEAGRKNKTARARRPSSTRSSCSDDTAPRKGATSLGWKAALRLAGRESERSPEPLGLVGRVDAVEADLAALSADRRWIVQTLAALAFDLDRLERLAS